jgi:hypothetical protein
MGGSWMSSDIYEMREREIRAKPQHMRTKVEQNHIDSIDEMIQEENDTRNTPAFIVFKMVLFYLIVAPILFGVIILLLTLL